MDKPAALNDRHASVARCRWYSHFGRPGEPKSVLQRLQARTLVKHLVGGLLCDAAASPDEVGAGKAGDVGADVLEGGVVGEDGGVGL